MKKLLIAALALCFVAATNPVVDAGLLNKIGAKLKLKHKKGAEPDAQAQAVGPGAFATAGNGPGAGAYAGQQAQGCQPVQQGAGGGCYSSAPPVQQAYYQPVYSAPPVQQAYYAAPPVYATPAAPMKSDPRPIFATPQQQPITGSPQQPNNDLPIPRAGIKNPGG